MKKILFSMIVGLASLGMGAATSQAGTFGLFVCGGGCGECGGCGHCKLFHRGCSKCCSTVCIRDYNAFSPSFCGNMTFNGCNPFCGGGGYPNCGPSIQACPSCGGCATDGCANPGCGAQAMPYGGPAQSAAMAMPYGGPAQSAAMAMPYPQSIMPYPQNMMPMGGQPNYYTAAYGR